MGSKRRLDSIDRQIVAILSHAPQISNRDVAAKLGIAESTVSVRVDSLVRDRIIKLSAQQNIVKAGYGVIAWVDVNCAFPDTDRIAAEISTIDNIFSISLFFENPFLQVMLFASRAADLRDIVERKIGAIPGVGATSVDISVGDVCIKQGIASL